jgi:hypothetical protein
MLAAPSKVLAGLAVAVSPRVGAGPQIEQLNDDRTTNSDDSLQAHTPRGGLHHSGVVDGGRVDLV